MVRTGCGVFWLLPKSQHVSTQIQSLASLYHGSLLSNVGLFCTMIVLYHSFCEGDYVQYESGLVEHVCSYCMRECLFLW